MSDIIVELSWRQNEESIGVERDLAESKVRKQLYVKTESVH